MSVQEYAPKDSDETTALRPLGATPNLQGPDASQVLADLDEAVEELQEYEEEEYESRCRCW